MMTAHSTPSRRRIALLATALTIGAVLIPAGVARADDGDVSWTVRTSSNDLGTDRTSFSYTINPGSTVTDAMTVANHGDTALDLGVYAADGYTTEDGQFDIVLADDESKAVGAWVTSATDHVIVQPGKTAQVPFTVSIPENATPGDYAGGIVTSLTRPDDTQAINVDRRLGIRITLRVGGDLSPALALEDTHLSWDGGLDPLAGDATLSYTLHNTGNAVVSATQLAQVTGPFGWFPQDAGTITAPPQLLPGESWTVHVPFRGVPAMFWLSGAATVTPVVMDASGSTTNLAPIVGTATSAAVPWMLLLIIVLLALLVLAAIVMARRRRVRRAAREEERVREAVEQALAEAQMEQVEADAR